ncbi:MAG: alpha/beta hydrolase, partial [Planctomycetota bacterium]|nr:alpha/beta hydrolase [Planctomycetota bacterium]
GPMTFQKGADFVAAVVAALDLPPVHLVGHSYGGEFTWRAALDAPELFRSLTLTSSSGYARTDDQMFPEEVEMRENSLADIGWWLNSPDRVETALAPHFATIPPGRTQEFFLVCENASNWRAMVDLVIDETGGRSDELPGLDLPVLLLWGAGDLAFPPETFGQRFLADLPDARLVTVDAGHYPPEERPVEYTAALASFLEELEGGDR